MKTPMISNYNNKYPLNNNAQASASRPNFGMHIVSDGSVLTNISHIAGAKNLESIKAFLRDINKDENMAEKFMAAYLIDHKFPMLIPNFDPHMLRDWRDTILIPKISIVKKIARGAGAKPQHVDINPHYKAQLVDGRIPQAFGYGISTIKGNPAKAVREAISEAVINYANHRILAEMV